jgi:hypothetical protein
MSAAVASSTTTALAGISSIKAETINPSGLASKERVQKRARLDGTVNGMNQVRKAPVKSYKIPKRDAAGPLTKSKAYRMIAIYLALAAVGTYLWCYSTKVSHVIFGAGLILPGSGFLALSGWWVILFPVCFLLFPVAVFGWFWCGNLLLPPIPYVGSATVAAWIGNRRHSFQVLSLAPWVSWTISLLLLYYGYTNFRESARKMETERQRRNLFIDEQIAIEAATTQATAALPQYRPGDRELSPKEIKAMRYLINLTRQPMDSWKGFTWQEQFRESALRYQLYHIVYGLSMIQSNVCPNFHGELSRAQRIAIEKTLRPEVLYYWAWESLWGRFSFNWDPVDKEK